MSAFEVELFTTVLVLGVVGPVSAFEVELFTTVLVLGVVGPEGVLEGGVLTAGVEEEEAGTFCDGGLLTAVFEVGSISVGGGLSTEAGPEGVCAGGPFTAGPGGTGAVMVSGPSVAVGDCPCDMKGS